MNQATQVNGWDKVLLTNGDKIVALNGSVEKVKAAQDTLEEELTCRTRGMYLAIGTGVSQNPSGQYRTWTNVLHG